MLRIALLGVDNAVTEQLDRRLQHAHVTSDGQHADAFAAIGHQYSHDDIRTLQLALDDKMPLLVLPELIGETPTPLCPVPADVLNEAVRIGFPYRHDPVFQTIRQQLDAGLLGDPGILRLTHWQAEPRRIPPFLWPVTWLHLIDAVIWLISEPPYRVLAFSRPPATVPGAADSPAAAETTELGTLQLHLRWASNAMALVSLSDQLPPGDAHQLLELIGSQGAASWDAQLNRLLLFTGGRPQAALDQRAIIRLAAMLQSFVTDICTDVCLTDGENKKPRHSWQAARRLLHLSQRSIQSGQSVLWEDAAP